MNESGKTAVLITHTHPPMVADAVARVAEEAARASWRLVATPDEAAKHGEAAGGLEISDRLPEGPEGAEVRFSLPSSMARSSQWSASSLSPSMAWAVPSQ